MEDDVVEDVVDVGDELRHGEPYGNRMVGVDDDEHAGDVPWHFHDEGATPGWHWTVGVEVG